MGYIKQAIATSRVEERRIGATCDRCHESIPFGPFGPFDAFEIRVNGMCGWMALHKGAERRGVDLIYCHECAEEVIDLVPGLKEALGACDTEGMGS